MLHMGMDMGRPGRYHVHRQGPMRPMLRGVHQQDGHLEHFLQVEIHPLIFCKPPHPSVALGGREFWY